MTETRGTPKSIFGYAKIEGPMDLLIPNYTKDIRAIKFFREKGATSEDKSISLTDEEYARYVDRYYRKLECFREAKDGKFWLDEDMLKHAQSIFNTLVILRFVIGFGALCIACFGAFVIYIFGISFR